MCRNGIKKLAAVLFTKFGLDLGVIGGGVMV
jgi:hypothetical protein